MYAVSIGSGDPWGSFSTGNSHNGAIVGLGSGRTSLRDIIDGTSNSLLIGEAVWNIPDYYITSGQSPGKSPLAINPVPDIYNHPSTLTAVVTAVDNESRP